MAKYPKIVQSTTMNYIISLMTVFSLALMVLLTACGTPQSTVSNNSERDEYEGKRVRVIQNPRTLADFLMQAPGVYIRGNEVSIRGGGPPLFIIDGVPVGNGYASAASAINPQDIESVEVVSGPDTAIYGRRGMNGVIIIRTRTS